MKITIDFTDIKKLIEEAYNGVNDVTTQTDAMEIMLDVDADKFSKKSIEHNNTMRPINIGDTKKLLTKFEPGAKVDYETVMLQKEIERELKGDQTDKIVSETHIPLIKSIEEKNKEARKNGLMVTGRGVKRTIVKGN